MLKFLKKKEKESDKEAENIEMIPVPDIRAYMIKGYEEIREVKRENEELKQKVKDLTAESIKNKQLYEAQLVVAQEFENRYNKLDGDFKEENKKRQEDSAKFEKQINIKQELIDKLKEENYILEEKYKNIKRYQKQKQEEAVKEYKDKLIFEIKDTKGRMSKDIVIDIIEHFAVKE